MNNTAERRVSTSVRALALFGRPGAQLGWGFVAVGMLGSAIVIRAVLTTGAWNGIASVLFPLLGMGLVFWDRRQTGDLLRLLKNGQKTPGRFVSRARQRRSSSSSGTSATTYIVRYSYEVEPGKKSYAQASTTRDDTLDLTTVLYDPDAPAHSLVLEYQPGAPRLEGERVVAGSPVAGYAVLLTPLAALAATVAAPLIVLTRPL